MYELTSKILLAGTISMSAYCSYGFEYKFIGVVGVVRKQLSVYMQAMQLQTDNTYIWFNFSVTISLSFYHSL